MSAIWKKSLYGLGLMALGATLSLGMQAAANPGGPSGGPPPPGAILIHLLEDLDLTEAQQTQLDELKSEMRDRFMDAREDQARDAEEMAEIITARKIDRAAMHARIDEQLAAQAELLHAGADQLADFHATLTEAQKAELADKIREGLERREERRDDRREELRERLDRDGERRGDR